MSKDLQKGDTICCSDYAEMRDVLKTLREQGYLATVGIGYTIRIESVPIPDETEADGFITRDQQ